MFEPQDGYSLPCHIMGHIFVDIFNVDPQKGMFYYYECSTCGKQTKAVFETTKEGFIIRREINGLREDK